MRMTKNWTVFKREVGYIKGYAFVSPNGLIEHVFVKGISTNELNKHSLWIGTHISELTPSKGWTKINVQKMSQANLAKGILE